MTMHRETIQGYKYLRSEGNIHIYGRFNAWRYLYVEVTTEQIEKGLLEKIIADYENKRKGKRK